MSNLLHRRRILSGEFKNPFSYVFDGVNEFINTQRAWPHPRTQVFSISFFIYQLALGTNSILDNVTIAATDPGIMLRVVSGKVIFILQSSAASRLQIESVLTTTANSWNYVTVNYSGDSNGNNCSIYINGVNSAVSVVVNSLALSSTSANNILIGRDIGNSNYLNGYINQIYVSTSYTITLLVHAKIYNGGKPKNPLTHISNLSHLFMVDTDYFTGSNHVVIDKKSVLGSSVNMELADKIRFSPY